VSASPDSLGWKTWRTETFAIHHPPNAELEGTDPDDADLIANAIRGPLSHGPDRAADYSLQLFVRENRGRRPLRQWVDSVLVDDRRSNGGKVVKPDTVRVGDLIFIRARDVTRNGHGFETFWLAGPRQVVTFLCTVHGDTAVDEEGFIAICESIVKSFHWR